MRIVLQAAGSRALPVGRPKLACGNLRHQHAGCSRSRHLARSLQVPNEPEFDDLKVDESLYKELGLDEDELEAQKTYEPDDIDPEGSYLDDLESMAATNPEAPPDLLEALSNATNVWGPKALLLAGLRLEEVAVTRAIMDAAGAADVKVVPTSAVMLHTQLQAALATPEPDWEQPRAPDAAPGGGWGSQRVALFSGMSVRAVAAAVEVLEESGLPPLCVALADEQDAQRPLGQVLAEAVRDQRGRKNPTKQLWEDSPRVSDTLPDLDGLIKQATTNRLRDIETAAKEGRLEEVLAEGAVDMSPEEVQRLKVQPETQPDEQPGTQSEAPGNAVAAGAAQVDSVAGGSGAAAEATAACAEPAAGGSTQPPVASRERPPQAASPTSASTRHQQASSAPVQWDDAAMQPNIATQRTDKAGARAAGAAAQQPAVSKPGRKPLYQQPAGPAPPPGLLEHEQFVSELRQRQQQEQEQGQQRRQQWPAASTAESQAATADCASTAAAAAAAGPEAAAAGGASTAAAVGSDAQDVFLAKYTFESLAMQREAREAEEAAAAAAEPSAPLMDWQAELAEVKATGMTRSDQLAGRDVQQGRRPQGSTAGFDLIDRIVQQPSAPAGDATRSAPAHDLPLNRDAIEAALRGGMDPAELKRLIDEAAAAMQQATAPPGAGPAGQPVSPAAGPQPRAEAKSGATLPWQQGGGRRRGRPALSRRSPFEGGAPRPRRRTKDSEPAVQTMTAAEVTAAARKLGKNPEAWLRDAQERGIGVVADQA